MPEVAEYLAGRVSLLPVLPLSQGEVVGVREDFVETVVFGDLADLATSAQAHRCSPISCPFVHHFRELLFTNLAVPWWG